VTDLNATVAWWVLPIVSGVGTSPGRIRFASAATTAAAVLTFGYIGALRELEVTEQPNQDN